VFPLNLTAHEFVFCDRGLRPRAASTQHLGSGTTVFMIIMRTL